MNNPFMKRIVYGKTIGFIIGLLAFVFLPMFWPEVSWQMRWGMLFLYTFIGATVGVFGVFVYHPVLRMRMPAWFRGTLIGGSLMLTVVLIAYPVFEALMESATIFTGLSPYWMILDAAIAGLIIDLIATKKVGEGPSLMTEASQ